METITKSRPELVNELKPFMKPDEYRSVMDWTTPQLNMLLTFYKASKDGTTMVIQPTRKAGVATVLAYLQENHG